MIKVNKKMYEKFVDLMNDYGEFLFGSDAEIKQQLELCLNRQGYWSGCSIRVYYNDEEKDFYVESRF